MTSTVLDAALCLLLVSGAVFAVAEAERPPSVDAESRADATANVLATSTATVTYTPATVARSGDGASALASANRETGPAAERSAHGTLAGLVAEAALANASVDGRPTTRSGGDFRRAVAVAITDAVGRPKRTQIVAVWRPYPGAALAARTTVGPTPPPDATVRAATLSVPSGASPVPTDAAAPSGGLETDSTPSTTSGADGFETVADAVAARAVAGMFPPRATRQIVEADAPESSLVGRRYRHLGSLLDARPADGSDGDEVAAANRRLAAALSEQAERDLRSQFETPAAAARAAQVDRVRVVVRRW